MPNLRNIAIKELFLGDIFAIRWGPLTSLIDADWGCSTVWQHLTNFEVSLRPWPRPLRTQKGDPSTYQAQSHSYTQKEWRAGLKVLHSWIGSFAAENQFEKVKIEWLGGGEELNPLLLEEGRSWFSAPAIRWKICKELWLGGIKVHANGETNDMERLLERVPGLQKIMVWPEMLDMGVLSGLDKFGIVIERKIIRVKGRKWMSMEIKRSPEILEQLISEIQVEAGATRVTNHSASIEENVFEDDMSVYATENIDEGNDNGNEYEDEDRSGYLSDGSMEVPLFVDLRYE